jgi:putative NADH-flavin reductase
VVRPEFTDTAGLAGAPPGANVVIGALGGADRRPTTVRTDGIRSAVQTMTATGLKRLIAVSDTSLYSRAVWAGMAERMRDKDAMEPLVTASGLSWTTVRPPKLTDHDAVGKYRSGTDLPIRLWSPISRAGLAAFLIDEAETARHVHAHPRITR